jgi:hypothetical protein
MCRLQTGGAISPALPAKRVAAFSADAKLFFHGAWRDEAIESASAADFGLNPQVLCLPHRA